MSKIEVYTGQTISVALESCHGASGEVVRLDRELAAMARQEAALRLRIGQSLELLGRGGHFELGFSSLSAYVLERCERSVRWAESARCLARRLEELPLLRGALAQGTVSWSKGEILGGAATPGTESAWLETAQGCTVRELRALAHAVQALKANGAAEHAEGEADTGEDSGEDEERCTLTCTVDREESWLFEATRALLDQLGTHGNEHQVEALLAEGQATLLAALPRDVFALPDLSEAAEAQRKRREQRERCRAEAEARCEERIRSNDAGEGAAADTKSGERGHGEETARSVAPHAARGLAAFDGWSAVELDRAVRDACRALASHEVTLALHLLHFHRQGGWRLLGYATEAQYARERLGMSRSSLLARRTLGLRLERLPRVADALRDARIGIEAALQLVRVATPNTEVAWIERALGRTVKHLREEVSAALVALRVSGATDCWPPADREIDAFHELERAVVGGRVDGLTATSDGVTAPAADLTDAASCAAQAEIAQERAWRVTLRSLQHWLAAGVQTSAATRTEHPRGRHSRAGRIELRFRVSRDTYDWWRSLEACARRWLPHGMSWLRFLCLSLWRSFRHLLGADVAYGGIYVRDRHRCTSPVCSRRDVTPHHVQFRSAGGTDDDANVIAVCTWCHLFGIHGGRIRASGTAGHVRWEIGPHPEPCVVVDGRRRIGVPLHGH